jgi:hypothetical protein
MSEAEFHRSESRKLHFAIRPMLCLSRCRTELIVGQGMFGDSFYFLAAALSLVVVIGWLGFVTIAAQA